MNYIYFFSHSEKLHQCREQTKIQYSLGIIMVLRSTKYIIIMFIIVYRITRFCEWAQAKYMAHSASPHIIIQGHIIVME